MISRIKDVLLSVCVGALLTVAAAQAQDASAGSSATHPPQETQEHGSDLTGQGQQQHEHHEGHKANPSPAGQQQPKTQAPEPQPEMEHMHHHMNITPVTPELPHLGKAEQEMAGPAYRLEELEQMAVTHNPTLAQAAASINSAKGRRLQSGLYPNPRVGYEGSEIRGGAYGGGEQGFFVEQPFITAGKLGLNRKMGDAEIVRAEAEAAAQRWRVLNAVRIAYYHVLAAQEMLAMKKSLQRISEDVSRVTRQLHNAGQADDTEVLQAEIEEEAAETAVLTQQNTLARLWTALATVIGNPRLVMGTVRGNLEAELSQPDDHQLLDSLLKESPQVRIAQAGVAHAQATLVRAKREPIPDIDVRAGLQQNGELLNPPSRSVGLQGFATVGIQLHIFDRNQGNAAAARAEVEKAQKELQRVDLLLRERFAATFQSYHNARIVVERYHAKILPRAQRAYELMVTRYGLMTASFPQVLNLQRTLYATETGYISALEALWINSIVLRGFLLTGGLEMPGQAGQMDLAPMPAGSMFDSANPHVNDSVAPSGMDSSKDR